MKAARVVAFVLVGLGAITGAVVFGQAPPTEAKKSIDLVPAPPNANFTVTRDGQIFGVAIDQSLQDQSAQLMDQYRKAQKDEDKKEIRKKLADELGKQFDAHMKQQQDELTALEKQIEELKALMKKRQEARTTIIERRMDQMIQEAEGLGWNAPGHPRHAGLWNRPGPVPYYRSPNAANRFPADKKNP